MIKTC